MRVLPKSIDFCTNTHIDFLTSAFPQTREKQPKSNRAHASPGLTRARVSVELSLKPGDFLGDAARRRVDAAACRILARLEPGSAWTPARTDENRSPDADFTPQRPQVNTCAPSHMTTKEAA